MNHSDRQRLQRKSLLYVSSAVLGSLSALPVQAQIVSEEIIVTAQKREQDLQDVGVSVTAFSSDQLNALGMTEATDFAAQTPGVNFESTSSGGVNAQLTVRGVAQTDFSSNQESPNAVYIDDIYLSTANSANFTFYDLQRIEILRGPQGTLFGRNSTGGLVNFISKRPSKDWEGYLDVSYGRFNKVRLEGAISGPISDNIRFRLSAATENHDGWWKNHTGDDTFAKRFYGVRAQVEADVTDDLVANLTFTYDRDRPALTGTFSSEPTYFNPATGLPTPLPAGVDAWGTGPGRDLLGYRDPYSDAQTGEFNDFGHLQKERASPTLRLKWDLGGVELTSLTNFTHFSYDFDEECDGTPIDACRYIAGQSLDQWSQETRVSASAGGLTWVTGLYYLYVDQTNYQSYVFPAFSGTAFAFNDLNLFDQRVRSFSLFGQIEYAFSANWRATVGARAIHDKRDFSSQVYFNELGQGYSNPPGAGTNLFDPPLLAYDFSRQTAGAAARQSGWDWSGKVQLDYIPDDDALFYLSASRGVKGAGFNTNLSGGLTIAQTPFKSETLYAYEFGTKTRLLDRLLRFNASSFYYDYRNFQAFQFSGISSVVTNNDGYMYGGEAEFASTPMVGLDLLLGVSYLKTKIKDVATTFRGTLNQEALNAPRWSVNGLVRKSFDLGPGSLALQWDFNYKSRRFSSVENTPATRLRSAFVHNARVSYDLRDVGLEFAVFVDNISDVDRKTFAFDTTSFFGNRLVSYAPPRWWGLQVRKTF